MVSFICVSWGISRFEGSFNWLSRTKSKNCSDLEKNFKVPIFNTSHSSKIHLAGTYLILNCVLPFFIRAHFRPKSTHLLAKKIILTENCDRFREFYPGPNSETSLKIYWIDRKSFPLPDIGMVAIEKCSLWSCRRSTHRGRTSLTLWVLVYYAFKLLFGIAFIGKINRQIFKIFSNRPIAGQNRFLVGLHLLKVFKLFQLPPSIIEYFRQSIAEFYR